MIKYGTKMPTSKSSAPGADEYICLFPSIGLKKSGPGDAESWLAEFYTKYPHADYYKQHAASGKKAVAGTFTKYQPTAESPGIINLFTKVYPGTKTYPNDNNATRMKSFATIFSSLSEQQGIGKLHLTLPSKEPTEQQEYLKHMEDFISSSKLKGMVSSIYIYGCDPIEPIVQTKNVKPKLVPPAPAPAPAAPVPVSAPAAGRPKLVFNESQLSSVLLYEVDFIRASLDETAEAEAEAVMEPERPGILKYFKDRDGLWSRLLDDTKLQKEAEKVLEKIGDLLAEVLPPANDMFNAFTYMSTEPKVVIIGQDPYHSPGEAHGLAFSVKKGVKVPPSLRNIYTALENTIPGFTIPDHGCLESWAKQGVLLLNSSLTVLSSKPGIHKDIWKGFTDRLIQLLSIKYPNLIYVLWGGDAKAKKTLITGKSIILEFNHPSPMVRNNTFATECKHFVEINEHLEKQGKLPIVWDLT